MVPATSSISLTLENMYTETALLPLPTDATADVFYINGLLQSEAEHVKMSKIIDRYRPAGEGFCSKLILKIICLRQRACHQVLVVCLPWSRLVMLISSLDWLGASWHRRLSLPQALPLGVFYGPLGAWDKDSGEIYLVETDLKLAMIMLVLEDKKKTNL